MIRRAEAREADALTDLCRAAKRHWGYPPELMAEWDDDLLITPAAIAAQQIYVGEETGRVVGFFGLRLDEAAAAWRLEHLWVDPAHIGRGCGRELFVAAVNCARSLGVRALHIEADPHAEGFYLKMGAVRRSLRVSMRGGTRRELPLMTYAVAPPAS